jgi:hypothetical protein
MRRWSGLRPRGVAGQGGDAPAFLGSAHITADELIPQRLLSPIESRTSWQPHRVPAMPRPWVRRPLFIIKRQKF